MCSFKNRDISDINTLSLHDALPILVVLTVLSLGFVLFNNALGIFEFGSKRIDMIIFTVSLITLLFALFSSLKEVTRFLQYISNYSLGIFLLHLFFFIIFKLTFMYIT